MVRRHHDHDPSGIGGSNKRGGHADAWGCISFEGFTDDVLDRQLRKLSNNRFGKLFIRCDENLFARDQACQSIESGLQHRAWSPHFQELLGFELPARRPKSSSRSTGHDDGM
jgi:hypothetical protein